MDDDEKRRFKALRRIVSEQGEAVRDELLKTAESLPEALRPGPLGFLDDDEEEAAHQQAGIDAEGRPKVKTRSRREEGITSDKGAALLEAYMREHGKRNIDLVIPHVLSEKTISRVRVHHRVKRRMWAELAKILGVPLKDLLE